MRTAYSVSMEQCHNCLKINGHNNYHMHGSGNPHAQKFLPWHRVYLAQFEHYLSNTPLSVKVQLPYWDWMTDTGLTDNGYPFSNISTSHDKLGGSSNQFLPTIRNNRAYVDVVQNSSGSLASLQCGDVVKFSGDSASSFTILGLTGWSSTSGSSDPGIYASVSSGTVPSSWGTDDILSTSDGSSLFVIKNISGTKVYFSFVSFTGGMAISLKKLDVDVQFTPCTISYEHWQNVTNVSLLVHTTSAINVGGSDFNDSYYNDPSSAGTTTISRVQIDQDVLVGTATKRSSKGHGDSVVSGNFPRTYHNNGRTLPSQEDYDATQIRPDWWTGTSWNSYCTQNQGIHDTVHVYIGGNMSFISRAPADLAFWLHHANVDRLWLRWEMQWITSTSQFSSTTYNEHMNLAANDRAMRPWGKQSDGNGISHSAHAKNLKSQYFTGNSYQGRSPRLVIKPRIYDMSNEIHYVEGFTHPGSVYIDVDNSVTDLNNISSSVISAPSTATASQRSKELSKLREKFSLNIKHRVSSNILLSIAADILATDLKVTSIADFKEFYGAHTHHSALSKFKLAGIWFDAPAENQSVLAGNPSIRTPILTSSMLPTQAAKALETVAKILRTTIETSLPLALPFDKDITVASGTAGKYASLRGRTTRILGLLNGDKQKERSLIARNTDVYAPIVPISGNQSSTIWVRSDGWRKLTVSSDGLYSLFYGSSYDDVKSKTTDPVVSLSGLSEGPDGVVGTQDDGVNFRKATYTIGSLQWGLQIVESAIEFSVESITTRASVHPIVALNL